MECNMYKIVVNIIDSSSKGNPVVHTMEGEEKSSIQEAMESYDAKKSYVGCIELSSNIIKLIEGK